MLLPLCALEKGREVSTAFQYMRVFVTKDSLTEGLKRSSTEDMKELLEFACDFIRMLVFPCMFLITTNFTKAEHPS